MSELLAQITLAARDSDIEGWMNILVVVAIAIVYGLSSILKAKAKKFEDKDEEELTRSRPARKPTAAGRALKEQALKQARRPASPAPGRQYRPAFQRPRAKVTGARRAIDKFVTEAKEPSRLAAIEPLAEPKLGMPTPQIQELPELLTRIEELPEFTSRAVEELGGKRVGIPAEMPESIHLPEILSDYADPEELIRAILHYEILGRPLSLRDPSGRIIGL